MTLYIHILTTVITPYNNTWQSKYVHNNNYYNKNAWRTLDVTLKWKNRLDFYPYITVRHVKWYLPWVYSRNSSRFSYKTPSMYGNADPCVHICELRYRQFLIPFWSGLLRRCLSSSNTRNYAYGHLIHKSLEVLLWIASFLISDTIQTQYCMV